MIVPEFDYKMSSYEGDHDEFDYYSSQCEKNTKMNNFEEVNERKSEFYKSSINEGHQENDDEEENEKTEHETIVDKYHLRDLIGTTISGKICNKRYSYLLVDLIGNGSFAAVFNGKREDGKYFAIKCIPKIDLNEDQLTNQLLEAETLIDLGSHPNILNLHHIIDNEKFLFLVLDLCDIDLYDILTQDYCGIEKNGYGGLAEKDVRYIFNKIADALIYCHNHGIYHRDLKPENILIRFYGKSNRYDVKLTDFGLCTKNDFSEAFGCGSLRYIPPECINDAVASDFMDEETITFLDHDNSDPFNKYKPREIGYSARANDAWAMGIILINLLFGRNPWFSASLDDECFMAFVKDDADFLRKKFGFSYEFNELVKKIFAFYPCDRYTLEEMVEIFNTIDIYYDDDYYQKTRAEFEKEYDEVYQDEENDDIEAIGEKEELISMKEEEFDGKMPAFEEKKTMLSQNFDKFCSSTPSANWSYGEKKEKQSKNHQRSRSRSYLHYYNVPDIDEKFNELPKDALEKISPVSTLYESSFINDQNFSFYHQSSLSNSISPTMVGETSYLKTGMDGQYELSNYSEKEERTIFEESKKNAPWSFIKPSSPKNISYANKNEYLQSHINHSSSEANTANSSFTTDLDSNDKLEEELIFYSDETTHYDNGSKEWKDMHHYHQRELYKKEIKNSKKLEKEKEKKQETMATTRVKSTGSTSLRLLIESIERTKAINSGKMKPCEDPAFYNMNPLRTPPGLKINNNNNNNIKQKYNFVNSNNHNHPMNMNKNMNSYYHNHSNNNNININSHHCNTNYINNNGGYNSMNYSMPLANQNQMNFMNLSYAMASNCYLVYQNNYQSNYINGNNNTVNPIFNKMNSNYYNNNNGYYPSFNTGNNINSHYNSNPMNYYMKSYNMMNHHHSLNPLPNYFPVTVGN
ncbi:kinase-like protein [Anaeromyces robustus]|jgi:serine/threonine protein kinase|uniref:non-specific serine/threonine protein kinase n=1 Tax=Anaeromyces robustus TaxID=1754192 RepID=A0A1Y1XDP2_9FUNG|nr:kinase-like protein [Anaeromyces robustus]|eukprot:ORX83845.1 kinase-like protein [Anaeromyces robustus]